MNVARGCILWGNVHPPADLSTAQADLVPALLGSIIPLLVQKEETRLDDRSTFLKHPAPFGSLVIAVRIELLLWPLMQSLFRERSGFAAPLSLIGNAKHSSSRRSNKLQTTSPRNASKETEHRHGEGRLRYGTGIQLFFNNKVRRVNGKPIAPRRPLCLLARS